MFIGKLTSNFMKISNQNSYRQLLVVLLLLTTFFLYGCNALKYKKVDAKEFPPDPRARVQSNIEEGRGFRIMGGLNNRGSNFEFASSNSLWKATLDTIDFMPLVSANYSGGIIITDWYAENDNPNEAVKLTIRFLTNEIRVDALDIKVFVKTCEPNSLNCSIVEKSGDLKFELNSKILKTATIYEREIIEKNKKQNPYTLGDPSTPNSRKKNKN